MAKRTLADAASSHQIEYLSVRLIITVIETEMSVAQTVDSQVFNQSILNEKKVFVRF